MGFLKKLALMAMTGGAAAPALAAESAATVPLESAANMGDAYQPTSFLPPSTVDIPMAAAEPSMIDTMRGWGNNALDMIKAQGTQSKVGQLALGDYTAQNTVGLSGLQSMQQGMSNGNSLDTILANAANDNFSGAFGGIVANRQQPQQPFKSKYF